MESKKYIIGSGWWCNDNNVQLEQTERVLYGDESIRGESFHKYWYESINRCCSPDKIVIVDSCSPVKPPLSDDPRIVFISLNENAGHAVQHTGKFGGWLRSVILSLQYATLSDCDYYVYVEQDVLLQGQGIIEYCIDNMSSPFMFGECKTFKNPLQQSFFIIRRDGFDSFLAKLLSMNYKDSMIMPERKFALATSPYNYLAFLFIKMKNKFLLKATYRLQSNILKWSRKYNYLPVGYGRDRPIKFNDKYFYFQHATKDELQEYFKLIERC
ncbi:hypothetical protein ACW5XE_18730 [Aeromonas caviae]|jgi:hypothetical protein|uniref:hypothetical protein n=1 Tax=Aeromonas caviae TaxID=648 RepID=UPI0029D772C0|nr:hypothetical protein [Aeromonas caviae]MDX7806852.1 hypothetical protein [Aeromonas caviae]